MKRAARDACEDEWKQIKIRHDNTVSAWKTECARLKVAGTQPRDLATKLKRPLKPKPVVEDDLDNDEEEEDEQMIVHSYVCVKWWFGLELTQCFASNITFQFIVVKI